MSARKDTTLAVAIGELRAVMDERTCETCKHVKIEDVRGRPDLRCMRLITHTSGAQFRSTSCVFETDSLPLAYRKPGDKCGPDRIHWEAKA